MSIFIEPVKADFWQLAKEPGSTQYLDPLGPKNCMTHTAARLVMRATEGKRPAGTTGVWPPTGAAIRSYCLGSNGRPDTTGGVNHRQVAEAVWRKYRVRLVEHRQLPFDDFIDLVEETRGAGLSVWYKRIRDNPSRRGSFDFFQNHELFISGVDRDRGVFTVDVDPLADGRKPGLFHGPGDYPIALLRMAAGELNVASNPNDYVKLGVGLCYAMVTVATGEAPAPPTGPHVVPDAPVPSERNEMLNENGLTVVSSHVMALAAGQPLFNHPGGKRVTAMSKAAKVDYRGGAGKGWAAVRVMSGAVWADGKTRPTVLYVPANAGPVSAK